MATDTLKVKTSDGKTFDCYVSRPKAGKAPVVIVIQEIFGVNKWVRSVADWLAGEGFLAVAPDLFHRIEPGIQLTDQSEAEWKRAFELFNLFDVDQGMKDLQDTVTAARSMEGSNGKVGSVGFCLGGKLAYLMSTRTDADANVGYYGVYIEKSLDEKIKHPVCLHIAGKDKFATPESLEEIKSALGNNPLVKIYVYENDDHAFARVGGEHYDKESAELAHKRSVEFLRSHLG